MVKITPNARNLDHAKKRFFTSSVFWRQNIGSKYVSFFLIICAILCLFLDSPKQKKTINK